MIQRDNCELVLRAMPGTLNQIAATSGLPKTTIKRWAMALRRAGWAHVGDWQRSHGEGSGGKKQPVIVPGPGDDAQEPPTLTRAETTRRSREKADQEGRLADQVRRWKESRRARYPERRQRDAERKARAKARKSLPFAALFWKPKKRRPRNDFMD